MNFTFFGCLVRGLPLPLGFLKGALFLLGPASKIQTRSKHSRFLREFAGGKREGEAGLAHFLIHKVAFRTSSRNYRDGSFR